MTLAPYCKISTESPVGRVAVTLPFAVRTVGCGPVADGEIAAGLFGRSMFAPLVRLWVIVCGSRMVSVSIETDKKVSVFQVWTKLASGMSIVSL